MTVSYLETVNHFIVFMYGSVALKIWQNYLNTVCLEIKLIKIGCGHGPEWAARNLRAATGVWQVMTLYEHFFRPKRFTGMSKGWKYIVCEDLSFVIVLEEISFLSEDLQSHSTTSCKADKKT
jgi:hypothetical protein